MKRLLSIVLTLALFITLLPPSGLIQQASAAGSYFLFPNEQDKPGSARIVSTQSVTLNGSINGVVGNSISYNVKQITLNGALETVVNTTEEITTGIATSSGTNNISISNLTLFPGLNKITFKGIAGSSTVSESIYIEYRNSPMLYDLKVTFENRDYDMPESEPTMLYSTAPTVQERGEVVISGKAPNAQKVSIVINGRSYDFNVSTATSDSRFSTSLLSIDKGINTVVLKVHNNGQIVETTREIAFYNGEVTFYNLKMSDSPVAPPVPQEVTIEPNMNFSTKSETGIKVSGSAILPLPILNIDGDNQPIVVNEANLQPMLTLELQQGADPVTQHKPDAADITISPATIDSTTKFITVTYTFDLPALTFDKSNRMRLIAPNNNAYQASNWTTFVLRDSTIAYIYDINYLSGYDPTMATPSVNTARLQGLQGTDIPSDGVNVYSMPMGVEVLVGNYTSLTRYTDLFEINGQLQAAGEFKQILHNEVVYRTVNNQLVPFLRLFIEINKLGSAGTNTVKINLTNSIGGSSEVKTIIAKLLYGPYVKFNTLVEGMKIEYDTVRETPASLLTKLGQFNGQLFNVASESEIVYTGTGQSVFLYINNVEIPLGPDSVATSKFGPTGTNISTTIFNVLNKAGDNTVKFVFRTPKNSYENTLKFSVVPTNLPVIPAPNTDGVYPYSANLSKPLPNDSNFVKQGSIFTTKEARLNVYGTFDFVDLGNADSFEDGHASIVSKGNYIVQITSPNWDTAVNWNLGMEFTPTLDGEPLADYANTPFNTNSNSTIRTNATTPDAAIDFFYDVKNQYFYFKMRNQLMPEDGSSQVYVVTVFNSGETGPRATYRMEIDSVSIPYTILAPLKEKRTTNQNFVEVIISSPGADSLVVGKQTAAKVKYIDYTDSTPQYVDAFSVTVKNLRPNRATNIDFTITRGQDVIRDSFEMLYQPANIPGAQFLQTMQNSHKVFDNNLVLTFARNSKLVRPSYNDAINHAGQVYSGNDILFAIANPNDGIVDRHEFESQPPNYSANSLAEGNLHIGFRFQDQARQFIKASPLYWIDGGQADNPDPSSPAFDPVTSGQDPFPFPNIVGKKTDSFAKRWNKFGLELVPTAPGTLTLSYDSNVAQTAGTTITVFRFDLYNSTWENIGGVVDDKKRTIKVPFTKFGYYVAVKLTRGYNDINDHPYAREAMEAIYSKGIMNAVDPIGVFGADRYVTRGEFTRMIIRALDVPLNYGGALHFSYYPETITNANNANAIYDYRYIETAARAGFVRGTRPGFFDEDVDLSRQDASVILARALNLKLDTDAAKAKAGLDKVFKDSGSFDYYSIPAVLAIQKKAFILGSPIDMNNPKGGSVFEPRSKLLRSDAAIIMARVLADLKKLPKIYSK
ncbi:S-layer homology domain-containing protein [Paenibacillus sp. sgz302251]|uniref:S-layer homology domain-containing protein n=1 Tax=Paenibacillus sp. sgz302251 TaxID=3414493 RepID=UPI003C7D6999